MTSKVNNEQSFKLSKLNRVIEALDSLDYVITSIDYCGVGDVCYIKAYYTAPHNPLLVEFVFEYHNSDYHCKRTNVLI